MTKRLFFYDTEFIECPGKFQHPGTISLISIGIVGEDGSEFYALNWDCDYSKASVWVQENVISKLPPSAHPVEENPWMTHYQLGNAVLDFLKPTKRDQIELWGYYAAYDHVALCWLFGPMIDLPPGIPMYTHDLKQFAHHLGNPKLPVQDTEKHNALADAHWNKQVYEFLTKISQ